MVMLHIYLIPSAAERMNKQTNKLHTIVVSHPKGRADIPSGLSLDHVCMLLTELLWKHVLSHKVICTDSRTHKQNLEFH